MHLVVFFGCWETLKKISLYHGSFGFSVGFYMFLNVTILYAKTSISESSIRHKSPFPKKRSFGPVHMSKKSSSKSEEKNTPGPFFHGKENLPSLGCWFQKWVILYN